MVEWVVSYVRADVVFFFYFSVAFCSLVLSLWADWGHRSWFLAVLLLIFFLPCASYCFISISNFHVGNHARGRMDGCL